MADDNAPLGGASPHGSPNQPDGGSPNPPSGSLRRFFLDVNWATVLVSLIGAVLTAFVAVYAANSAASSSNQQLQANIKQFTQSSQDTYYWNIINGLGSNSAAVQISSMRMLNLYVQDLSKFDGSVDRQRLAVAQALATLAAFVRKESGQTSNGLRAFSEDVPLIIEPALREIKDLASNWRLGAHGLDINEADLHGLYIPGFTILGQFAAPAADFRRADLTNIALVHGDLKGTFFTCATLQGGDLGGTSVEYADFTGADLRDADLSHVQNLDIDQLTGVWINDGTKLPANLKQEVLDKQKAGTPEARAWLEQPKDQRCSRVIREMTGMIAAQGYSDDVPCPTDPTLWASDPVLSIRIPAERLTEIAPNLSDVCRTRDVK